MVVLVRCTDNSCSLALKSRLNDLVSAGLVTAYLHNGEWLSLTTAKPRRGCRTTDQKAVGSQLATNF